MDFSKKLKISIITLIALSLCLCVTTFALVYSMISVDGNLFSTGKVSIDLNGGAPVVQGDNFRMSPGKALEKEFYIQNNGTADVYYKLYFTTADGDLADVIDVTVKAGDKVLYFGKPVTLTKENVGAADDILLPGERRVLTIEFSFPEAASNSLQKSYLTFDLRADAVQAKNNPDRAFD